MNKTVFVCGFSQESNSFNPKLTELEVFRGYEIFEGGETPEKPVCLPDANGMLEFFKEAGVEINDQFEALLAGGCIEEHIEEIILAGIDAVIMLYIRQGLLHN